MRHIDPRGMITLTVALALAGCMKPNPLADSKWIEQADDAASDEAELEETDDGTAGETGDGDSDQPGDGDGDGDGDGEPTSGDGDGDGEPEPSDDAPAPEPEPGDGDGDGEPEPGDGDGDGEPEPDDPDEPLPLPDLPSEDEGSCTPFDGVETECAACLMTYCCDLAAACDGAPGCACLTACVLAGEPEGQCKQQCDADPDQVPQLGNLLACAETWCDPC